MSPHPSTSWLFALPILTAVGIGLVASSGCGDAGTARRLPPLPTPAERPTAEPFLHLPAYAHEAMPPLLSQTGAFSDTATLTPAPALLPYEVNAPLWSDGARKQRWLALPHQPGTPEGSSTISFSATGEWYFPSGTVTVKQFDLPLDERDPTIVRRLETRVMVRSLDGLVYGATYRWRDDQRDAELLYEARQEDFTITARDGSTRIQHWTYPGRADCLTCHNRTAGSILGVTTRQLNRSGADGLNQLAKWNAMGLFEPAIPAEHLAGLPHLTPPDDPQAPLAERVRSYLDANCSHCHRPGAMVFTSYDARASTPLELQNLLYVRPVNDYGIDRVRYIKPNDPWRSMLLVRLERSDTMKMPPLGRNVVDQHAVDLMRTWITSMEGPRPLPPPVLDAEGDPAHGPVTITVHHSDPLAALHYTLDGTLPDDDSPRYATPLRIDPKATLRVKAIRDGYASSIAVSPRF